MRRTFLILPFGILILTRCAAIDSATDDWVLNAVCSDIAEFSLDPTTDLAQKLRIEARRNGVSMKGDSVTRPPCPKKKEKVQDKEDKKTFSLTPTTVDTPVDCTTKSGGKGTCILYYQCNPGNQTAIDDGGSIIDLRINECPHYLEVCCKEVDQDSLEPYRFTEDSPTGNDLSTTASPTATKPAVVLASKKVVTNSKPRNTGCGWSNPGASLRLRSGEADEPESPFAQYGEFPWMVALLKKSDDSGVWSDEDYLGGGTMIHPSVVLTVAHKLTVKGSRDRRKRYKPEDLKCRAGEWDTQTTRELFPHQERDVDRYVIHKDYDHVSILNSVALLILKKPFDLAQAYHMGTGCLATSLPAPGSECYSMGWGRDFTKRDKKLPFVLKKVKLNFVEHKNCQEMLRKTRLGSIFELHDSLTCANGEPDVDTCRGDGGSSLVCPIMTSKGVTRYAVYGMVAYGIECGNPEVPGVYANIPHLKSWVDKTMREENFGSKYYNI